MFSNALRWCLFLILILTAGCAYSQKNGGVKGSAETQTPQLSYQENAQKLQLQKNGVVWEEKINELIAAVQQEIEKNNSALSEGLSPEDNVFRTQKKETLAAYFGNLKRIKILQQKIKGGDTALSREIFYLDLIDRYLATLKSAEALRRQEFSIGQNSQTLENEIADSYQKNNYYRVVEIYDQLAKTNSGEKINFTANAYYALSLIRLNQEEDARKVIEEFLFRDFSLTSENAPLCFALGEWLINNGLTQRGQELFKKLNAFYINEEAWYAKVKGKAAVFQTEPQNIPVKNKVDQARALFQERGDFLGAYQLGISAQKECLDLACQNGVQNFLNQLTEQGKNYIDTHLSDINNDIRLSKYSEAQALLLSLKKSFPPGDYPSPLQEKISLIAKTEAQLKNYKPLDISGAETETVEFEKANRLLESEKFEEAIELYEKLEATPYKNDAAEKKRLAIDGLARTLRQKAGQLFLKARNCSNVEQKKNYLIESHNLLKSVLDKYPNNAYADRIIKNLTDVRAEIEKVYPQFFSEKESLDKGR